jgi:hypothetical protein
LSVIAADKELAVEFKSRAARDAFAEALQRKVQEAPSGSAASGAGAGDSPHSP